jgi:hypothetical protein
LVPLLVGSETRFSRVLPVTRRQANLLRVFAVWTLWVWGTRIWNIWNDDQSFGFKAVHTVLAVVSIVLAIAALVVVSRVRRKALAREEPPRELSSTGSGPSGPLG